MTRRPTGTSKAKNPRKCYAPPSVCKSLREDEFEDTILRGTTTRRPRRTKKELVAAARPALEKLGLIEREKDGKDKKKELVDEASMPSLTVTQAQLDQAALVVDVCAKENGCTVQFGRDSIGRKTVQPARSCKDAVEKVEELEAKTLADELEVEIGDDPGKYGVEGEDDSDYSWEHGYGKYIDYDPEKIREKAEEIANDQSLNTRYDIVHLVEKFKREFPEVGVENEFLDFVLGDSRIPDDCIVPITVDDHGFGLFFKLNQNRVLSQF